MSVLKASLAASLLCLIAETGSAHVVLKDATAASGSEYEAIFVMPQRCGESITTALRITLPEGVYIAEPKPKSGWKLGLTEEKLPQSVTLGGHALTTRPKEILWEIGSPRPDYTDEFAVVLRLPASEGTLYFPAIQVCEKGERRWVEIPPQGKSASDLRYPAPSLKLEPAATTGAGKP